MAKIATGSFDVKLEPQPADAYADGAALGRMSLDKRSMAISRGPARARCSPAWPASKVPPAT
jgi:hypothetical protein